MSQRGEYSKTLEMQLKELLDEDLNLVIEREKTAFDKLTNSFGNQLVLFGAGNLGRKTLAGLRKVGIEPIAFADNNPNIWNTSMEGLQILSPEEAAKKFGQTATFITTIWRGGGDRQSTRQKQLSDLNCANVISFGYLFWKYSDLFLPHGYLELPSLFREHTEELRKLFYMWADDNSRREYLAQLRFRMRLDFDGLPSPVSHKQYFPNDLFSILPEEVFVDCGAFDGDTIRDLLHQQTDFLGQIFAFEPDDINFSKLQRYISTLPASIQERIIAKHSPVGMCDQKVRFSSTGTISSKASETGEVEMDCICIDQDTADSTPTYIKMDIEGAEIDALHGARETIQRYQPILAVCLYHRPDHLWKIPLLISSYYDDYNLFLRPHDEEGWELVCYAVPPERFLIDKNKSGLES